MRAGLITRRHLLRTTAAAAALAALPARAQAQWPDRTVRVIVPYPAGGSADILNRLYAEQFKERFGQPFVVENRPGAGGNTGIDAVAKSAPTATRSAALPSATSPSTSSSTTSMPFDPEKDIVPVALTYDLPNVVVVSAQHVPAKTLAEFIAWAKTKEQVTYGSPGVGTSPHLSGALFSTRNSLKAVHVPFRGAAQTIPAMLSGDVTFAIDNLASYISLIQNGQMRALAVTSAERWPTLPDVPTMAEAGMPDFVVTSWAAIVVPAGTPRPIIDKLSTTIEAIAKEQAMKDRFLQTGARILSSTPEAALAFAAKERATWRDVVKISGAKAQ